MGLILKLRQPQPLPKKTSTLGFLDLICDLYQSENVKLSQSLQIVQIYLWCNRCIVILGVPLLVKFSRYKPEKMGNDTSI